jgi:CHAD domain-containing protein
MLKTQDPEPIDQTLRNQSHSLDLKDIAYRLIRRYFRRIVRPVDQVLADRDPEPLHQMRVSIRHLRATLRLFEPIVSIPKDGKPKALRKLGRLLGAVRNLDVAQQNLLQNYYPQLPEPEQAQLDKVVAQLQDDRKVTFRHAKQALKSLDFEPNYRKWLQHPQYKDSLGRNSVDKNGLDKNNQRRLPPELLLPSLLNATIAQTLLHPGWAIDSVQGFATQSEILQQSEILHDLRKICKQTRYQLEDVKSLYGEDLKAWIMELQQIQDCLGTLQDLQVLQELIQPKLTSGKHLATFEQLLHQQRQTTLKTWEELRSNYLDPELRNQRYQLIFQIQWPSSSF